MKMRTLGYLVAWLTGLLMSSSYVHASWEDRYLTGGVILLYFLVPIGYWKVDKVLSNKREERERRERGQRSKEMWKRTAEMTEARSPKK